MSGYPRIEPYRYTQLLIVHMDDSVSEIIFGGKETTIPGHDGERWELTADGLTVHRWGGRTTFHSINIKSFTVVYPDETIARMCHLDPADDDTGNEPTKSGDT